MSREADKRGDWQSGLRNGEAPRGTPHQKGGSSVRAEMKQWTRAFQQKRGLHSRQQARLRARRELGGLGSKRIPFIYSFIHSQYIYCVSGTVLNHGT